MNAGFRELFLLLGLVDVFKPLVALLLINGNAGACILRKKGESVTSKPIKGLLPVPAIMANHGATTAARAEVRS